MARALLLALIACAVGLLAPAGASARPSISHLRASRSSLPSGGGTINVTARTRGARRCTLEASPRIAGLPHTIRCRRNILFRVRLPSNDSLATTHRYVLTLRTSGKHGARAHVTVRVEAHIIGHTPPPKEGDVVQVAAATYGACAVVSDGHVYCWGENYYGEVGNGTSGATPVSTPVEVHGISEAKQVAVGEYNACALLRDGHVDCWGRNAFGQTGNGETSEMVTTPVQVNVEGATQIAVGWEFACALLTSGHVTCWGSNDFGTIGNGTNPETKNTFLTPTEASVEHVLTLRAHDQRACVVLESGSVECWGDDFFDQLGNGEEKILAVPTPAVSDEVAGASGVAIGGGHTCVLESGSVACWGENHHGQLGDGEIGEYEKVVYKPAAAVGISTAAEIDAGEEFSCARLTDGHEDCWGENIDYVLGNGKSSPGVEEIDTPTEVIGLTGVMQIATGANFNCTLVTGGHLFCWGFDQDGQVGNGESGEAALQIHAPVEVKGLP